MSPREWFQQNATREPWHVERFVRSLEWIAPFLSSRARIIEAGGGGPFSAYLQQQGCLVESTAPHDLRYPIPMDGQFDLALSMEVIEHVKDQDRKDNLCSFDASGIRCVLSELRRLSPRLFLTTPNACSYNAAKRLLSHEHPVGFQLHHRELAPRDVLKLLQATGWKPIRHEIKHVWNQPVTSREKEILSNAAKLIHGDDSQLHGDCFFVLAERA